MNDDDALRTALARADAALPPPAGRIVTAATLHARLRRRRLQHALVATLLLSAGAATFAVLRAPAETIGSQGAPPHRLAAAMRAGFAAELADLSNRLGRLDVQGAAIEADLARCEMAATRAAAAHEHFALVYQTYVAGSTGNGNHR
jgi:hypothetical protein